MATRSFAFFICLAALCISFVAASSRARNPLHFLAKVEQPVILKTRNKINAFSTFDLQFELYKSTQRIKLSLEPNHDVLAENALVNYLGEDGRIAFSEPIDRNEHQVYKGTAFLENAQGSWAKVGWARITVYRDGPDPLFEGAFTINHDHHHIQLSSTYTRSKNPLDPTLESTDEEQMLVYRDSDISPSADGPLSHAELLKREDISVGGCSADSLEYNKRRDHPLFRATVRSTDSSWGRMSRGNIIGKRQSIDTLPGSGGNAGVLNLTSSIGQKAGCPSTKKVALVGVATDCGYTSLFRNNQTLRRSIIRTMNTASSVWEDTFNISLGLQALTISPPNCPGGVQQGSPWNRDCKSGLSMQDRLNLFSAWRGNLADTNSHWTLFTKCQQDGEVGLAWLGQACVQSAQTSNVQGGGTETVTGANVVAMTGTEWQVVAHETGHTFGAVHDCDSSTCEETNYVETGQCCPLSATECSASSQYIMNPFTLEGQSHFSPCTIGNICGAIGRKSVNTECLSDNRGITTITGHQCGNGIVEEGEECDCGGDEGCSDDPCCNPQTCKYINGAVCDDANEDCCVGCQFASKGKVCRPSTGNCDPEEKCPGDKATCPRDIVTPDGQSCSLNNPPEGAGDLACASGQCTSRNLQCQTVMGAFTRRSNETYACDDNTCTLTCGSPLFGSNTCYSVPQNMLDGTPCGGGGHCRNGQCLGSSFGQEVAGWVDDHKGIVIGVSVAVGVILLIAITSCLCGCIRRHRQRKRLAKLAPPQAPPGAWYGPPPFTPGPAWSGAPGNPRSPPPLQQQTQAPDHASNTGWRPPSQSPPPPPPPHGLYGRGIIGSRGVQHQAPLYPSPPPPSHFTGASQSSPRYA